MSIDEAMAEAVRRHQAGRLGDAEHIYRQVLAAAPQHFDATQLLGLALYQTARHAEALPLLQRAVAQNPSGWGPRCNLALTLLELGRPVDAIGEADAALALNPDAADALFCRAAALFQADRWDESVRDWRRVTKILPTHAGAWTSLGLTLEKLGRFDDALAACEKAVQVDPASPDAHVNLAALLSRTGRFDEAARLDRRAQELAPSHLPALLNGAQVAYREGRYYNAATFARRAVAISEGDPAARSTLAAALRELGRLDEAEHELQAAATLVERAGVGTGDAANHLRLNAITLLPSVYDSAEEMTRSRRKLASAIDAMRRTGVTVDVADTPAPTLFALAYQGENDREIMRSFAELIVPPAPPTPPRPASPHGRKIRVGFVSRFLRDHTIGRLNVGLISELSRERFDVTVLKLIDESDPIADRIRAASDRYLVLPAALDKARRIILDQSLDVLIYTDLGMDPVTYSISLSRLAPVQCVTWGHPVTSGVPAIDYFLSAVALEPPGSDCQYTERLVRLNTPAVYYYRPSPPAQLKTRVDFGLADNATVYGCLQSLFKIHPEFDPLLTEVLRRDPRGIVLLLQGASNVWSDKLLSRLRRTVGDDASRIRMLPQMSYDDFLSLNSLCDVMLDPIHFGGGNTSYEAFAMGVPVITWPSQMLRGRISYALYELMGVDDCVAPTRETYAELAVSVATDPRRRREIAEKILNAADRIFENPAGVREFESFLIGHCI